MQPVVITEENEILMRYTRRNFAYVAAGCVAATAGGCGSPEAVVKAIPESQLQTVKLVLKGYQIVSLLIGQRVVMMPHPAMRILSVVINVSSSVAKMAVDYISEELMIRRLEEKLTAEERSSVEGAHFVKFTCETGLEQLVYLAPTQYSSS